MANRFFMTRTLLGALSFWVLTAATPQAEDWPNFRGPDYDGISDETGWRKNWAEKPPAVVWKAEVGIGFSAFVVADGKALTLGHIQDQEVLSCFDEATGERLWRHRFPSELGAKFYIGGPGSTPTVDVANGLVYQLGKWGEVYCLNLEDGSVKWFRNVAKEEKLSVPSWGFNGSPLLSGELVVLNLGPAGMALNRLTGKTVWSSQGDAAGYSTPVPHEDIVIVSSGDGWSGVETLTGATRWTIDWATRYGVNAADPIVWDGKVFVSSGYQKGSGLFSLNRGELPRTWAQRLFRSQQNAPVRLGAYLYGIDGDSSSRAKLKCLEWETGEVQWTEDTGYGAVAAADNHLIYLRADGRLGLAEASPKAFEPIAETKVLTRDCWTVPVLANGRIFCRNSRGQAVAVDVRNSP